MDVRTISGAAYPRPPTVAASAADTVPLDESKGAGQTVPYLSPVYRFDPVAQLSILSFRDTTSGAVTTQIPSEKVVEQYRRNHGESPDALKSRAKPVEPAPTPSSPSAPVADSADTTASAPAAKAENEPAVPAAAPPSAPVAAASVPNEAAAPSGAATDVQRVSLKI